MDSMAQDEAEAPSCEYDPNSNFSGEIKVSNDPPDAKMLKRVEGLEIVDVEGKSRTFGSLFEELKEGERVVVVFIRHFFCGVGFYFPFFSLSLFVESVVDKLKSNRTGAKVRYTVQC